MSSTGLQTSSSGSSGLSSTGLQTTSSGFVCVPYSEEACLHAAATQGLVVGSDSHSFAGNYGTKGCYAYSSGPNAGSAFYGRGGTASQKSAPVQSPKYRVPGHDCAIGVSTTGLQTTSSGSSGLSSTGLQTQTSSGSSGGLEQPLLPPDHQFWQQWWSGGQCCSNHCCQNSWSGGQFSKATEVV